MLQPGMSRSKADPRRCSGLHESTITHARREPVPLGFGEEVFRLWMVVRLCGILPSKRPSSDLHRICQTLMRLHDFASIPSVETPGTHRWRKSRVC